MGYLLLFESMTESVIFARDKWLKQDGLVFPDKAAIFLAGLEDFKIYEDTLDFWNNVYGI